MSDAITEVVAPPWFSDMVRVESYAEIDEILKSTDFLQGSHRESGMFLGGTLLTTDGSVHAERRKMLTRCSHAAPTSTTSTRRWRR